MYWLRGICINYLKSEQGFSIEGVIGVVVAVIMILAVGVPITKNVITSANLSGTDLTVATILPTLMIVALIVVVVSLYR